MAYTRARPASHWLDYPDITYGTVGSAEFGKWDTALDQLKGNWLDIRDYGADSSSDAAAAVTAALPAVSSVGANIVIPPGTWTWSSVPALPSGITGKLRIFGLPGSKIVLTTAGPRFLDFNKLADHDTFQNIELCDLFIDCNNVQSANTTDHVILGTTSASASLLRINLDNIAVRRVRAVNVPTDATYQRHGIRLSTRHLAGGEATQNTIKNILVEDVRVVGGIGGVSVICGGSTPDATMNVYLDNAVIDRCYHDAVTTPTSSFTGYNFHVGNFGYGRYARIRNCIGKNSPDVGIEINAMVDGAAENCWVEEAYACAFFHRNYRPTEDSDEQIVAFRNCHARRNTVVSSDVGKGRGFHASKDPTTGASLGTVIYDNCSWRKTTSDLYNDSGTTGEALTVSATMRGGVIVDKFRAVSSGVNYSGAGAVTPRLILFNITAETSLIPAELVLRDVKERYSITRSGAGAVNPILLDITSTTNTVDFLLDGIYHDIAGSGLGGSAPEGIQFSAGKIKGSVRNHRVLQRRPERAREQRAARHLLLPAVDA
jgi:hypothetical protein